MPSVKKTKLDIIVGAKDKFSAPFRKMSASMDAMTAKVASVSAKMRDLSARTGASALTGSVQRMGSAFSRVGQAGSQSISRMTGLLSKLSLAVAGTSGGLFALARNTAAQAEAVGLTARSVGIAVTDLQKWQYAAKFSNISSEQMAAGLKLLSKGIADAAAGSKESAAAFRALGVSIKTSDGTLKNSSQVMIELADAFEKMQDGPTKTAIAMRLFGKAGAGMVPFLSQGSRAIRDLGQEARELGIVFDESESKLGAGFNYALGKSQSALQGLANSIGKTVLPVITPLLEKFSEWIKLNHGLVAAKVGVWVQSFSDKIPALLDAAERWMAVGSKIFGWCTSVVEFIGGVENALIAIAAYISAPFVGALLAAGKAVLAFGATLMATPIGWVMAGIAALAGAVYLIRKNWDSISGFFAGVWDGVIGVFKGAWDYISGIVGKVIGAVSKVRNILSWLPGMSGDKGKDSRLSDTEPRSSRSVRPPAAGPGNGSGFREIGRAYAQASSVRRTESVERTEVRLIPPDGWSVRGAEHAGGVTVDRSGMGYATAY